MNSDPEASQFGPETSTATPDAAKSIFQSGDRRVRNLVRYLDYLASSADKVSSSRAALAELRQAIKDPMRGAKHVVPSLGLENKNDEDWFYRIASLFAMHRKHQSGISLGYAFRRVSDERGSDSIEGRFLALLSASQDQLFDRLVGAITLLKADEQPLDWCKLLDDARYWSLPDKPRQHALARDYYRASSEDDGASTPVAAPAA